MHRDNVQVATEFMQQNVEAAYCGKSDATELALRLNRSQPYIAKLERGRGNISYDTICRYVMASTSSGSCVQDFNFMTLRSFQVWNFKTIEDVQNFPENWSDSIFAVES
jgi:predicted transcriptional regulator